MPHISSTALLMLSTYGPHITAHTSLKMTSTLGTPQIIAKYVAEISVPLKCHM